VLPWTHIRNFVQSAGSGFGPSPSGHFPVKSIVVVDFGNVVVDVVETVFDVVESFVVMVTGYWEEVLIVDEGD